MSPARTDHRQDSTRTAKFEGIVLKTALQGEGNIRVCLLSQQEGAVTFTAFGAGKEKSKRCGIFLTGAHVSLLAYRKSIDSAWSVKEASLVSSFDGLRGTLKKQSYFLVLLEALSTFQSGGGEFALFSELLAVLQKMDESPRVEKYAFHFLFLLLRSEGYFPAVDTGFYDALFALTKRNWNLGDGTLRFLKDGEIAPSVEFLDRREISVSVVSELMELFSSVYKSLFNRPLCAFSLISGACSK